MGFISHKFLINSRVTITNMLMEQEVTLLIRVKSVPLFCEKMRLKIYLRYIIMEAKYGLDCTTEDCREI